jgi:hypothetical protein
VRSRVGFVSLFDYSARLRRRGTLTSDRARSAGRDRQLFDCPAPPRTAARFASSPGSYHASAARRVLLSVPGSWVVSSVRGRRTTTVPDSQVQTCSVKLWQPVSSLAGVGFGPDRLGGRLIFLRGSEWNVVTYCGRRSATPV